MNIFGVFGKFLLVGDNTFLGFCINGKYCGIIFCIFVSIDFVGDYLSASLEIILVGETFFCVEAQLIGIGE